MNTYMSSTTNSDITNKIESDGYENLEILLKNVQLGSEELYHLCYQEVNQ
jgi:hypothetical protein